MWQNILTENNFISGNAKTKGTTIILPYNLTGSYFYRSVLPALCKNSYIIIVNSVIAYLQG